MGTTDTKGTTTTGTKGTTTTDTKGTTTTGTKGTTTTGTTGTTTTGTKGTTTTGTTGTKPTCANSKITCPDGFELDTSKTCYYSCSKTQCCSRQKQTCDDIT